MVVIWLFCSGCELMAARGMCYVETYVAAVNNGHRDVLDWAEANGLPMAIDQNLVVACSIRAGTLSLVVRV